MGSVNVDPDIFKILIATDNHLGYNEKDPVRGNDSYNTFEEILELAVENEVDFILLGGDLFHDNKPSRNSLLQCMQLLRKYTFGDRPVHFDFVSDPSENFQHLKNPTVNYLDPNLNVAIPVFSIHGNHDDPSGLGQHSPLDMLSTVGLVNYFGRVKDLSDIKVSPILLTKGKTKLALYGLSAVKDERLYRLFREGKVAMLRPKEDLDEWFNIFVLHQNHTKHSLTNYIPEQFLDNFLHLVIWGHEHECLIEPKLTDGGTFFVSQPGSSVATSLCPGEAVPKKVALLEVNKEKLMRVTGLDLKTVRPFVFDELCLKDHDVPLALNNQKSNPLEDFVEEYVRSMIEKSKEQLTGHSRQPTKPLIRLRVEYTEESQMFNVCRFGYKFHDIVANSEDIILFKKYKQAVKKQENDGIDEEAMDSVFAAEGTHIKVEDLVEKYFAELEDDTHKLQLLTERGLAHAVGQFIEKDDRDALQDVFMHQVNKTVQHLKKIENLDDSRIEEEIENFRLKRVACKKEDEVNEVIEALENPNRAKGSKLRAIDNDDDIDLDSDIEIMEETNTTVASSSRGRATGRGSRGSRGPRGNTRGSRSTTNKSRLEFLGIEDDDTPPARGRGSRSRARGRGSSVPVKQTQTSIMDSFAKSSSRSSQRKGTYFDSDSDD